MRKHLAKIKAHKRVALVRKLVEVMLPVPKTISEHAEQPYQLLSVFEEQNDDCTIHVAIADVFDHYMSWGVTLARILRAIAHELARDRMRCSLPEDKVVAAICDGFNHEMKKQPNNEVAKTANVESELGPEIPF
jgi:hypothetical protein